MLNTNPVQVGARAELSALVPPQVPDYAARRYAQSLAHGTLPVELDDEASPIEWSEEDIVLLHWRLLQEVKQLEDPAAPLEEKFDTLRWVFTEREKDGRPFSFASCLRVVGCSPLSPIPYCGLVDAEEVRDRIRHHLKTWLNATLQRYPEWVREAVIRNPAWIEARLAKNPQWINEQIKRMSEQGDLFA
ncbi:hypothetical protein P3W85_03175 [Cupriavidus basilensis]|uniref:Uncharacterized protein n=1 Tax=Cupriavidus basilensis TaxID=68895 RepID=A0ABT6AH85_9BURK|nr:hypothetical protein [Cupriavidus basilensis]MDF3831961.1 hypothetical protein [Cupriavidus basilensis]